MATILGRITLDEVDLIEVSSDPSAGGGTNAPIGSIALDRSGFLWTKYDAPDVAWKKVAASATGSFIGVSSVTMGYSANATNGRYLEQYAGNPSDKSPYIIPVNSTLIAISVGSTAVSTATFGIFKTTDLVTPISSISLAAQTSNLIYPLSVALNSLDKIAVRVTAGSANKPLLVFYFVG